MLYVYLFVRLKSALLPLFITDLYLPEVMKDHNKNLCLDHNGNKCLHFLCRPYI